MSKHERIQGEFGTTVATRTDIWYGVQLVELIATGEPGPRGGAPERVQVLLSLAEATRLRDHLSAMLADD